MIQVPAQASVFVMHESVNFRKGIDGMAAVARVVLGAQRQLHLPIDDSRTSPRKRRPELS